jgi:quercetin dioxygenase-like cupin family protein
MYRVDAYQFESSEVTSPGAVGVRIQWLIDESRGAPNFALRRFVIEPGGSTPHHTHNWEHEVYVLRGRGLLVTDGQQREIGPDMAILIEANEPHQFCALPEGSLEFLCMVPNGPATAK